MTTRYGIAEWYGEPFVHLTVQRRQVLAEYALSKHTSAPLCPFQAGNVRCGKKGGVCSIQSYIKNAETDYRLGESKGTPVITCPRRFEQDNLISKWLAQIVGFSDVFLAREVPFMRSPTTRRAAGRIDIVLSGNDQASEWFGLEIQAVYFSGSGMQADFELLRKDTGQIPPMPTAVRRPDWRSSSAKRLMPQLQIKTPTLRRWGTKLAVSVDLPFYEAIGGISDKPSHDLDEGDIIWLIPRISNHYELEGVHWEVLSLEESSDKLLSAETVKRKEFEEALRARLQPLSKRKSIKEQ